MSLPLRLPPLRPWPIPHRPPLPPLRLLPYRHPRPRLALRPRLRTNPAPIARGKGAPRGAPLDSRTKRSYWHLLCLPSGLRALWAKTP